MWPGTQGSRRLAGVAGPVAEGLQPSPYVPASMDDDESDDLAPTDPLAPPPTPPPASSSQSGSHASTRTRSPPAHLSASQPRFGASISTSLINRHQPRSQPRSQLGSQPGSQFGGSQTGASQTGASLTGAWLTGASLTGASQTGASQTGRSLTGASQTGASQTGRSLAGRSLTGASQTGGSLTGGSLTGSQPGGQQGAATNGSGEASTTRGGNLLHFPAAWPFSGTSSATSLDASRSPPTFNVSNAASSSHSASPVRSATGSLPPRAPDTQSGASGAPPAPQQVPGHPVTHPGTGATLDAAWASVSQGSRGGSVRQGAMGPGAQQQHSATWPRLAGAGKQQLSRVDSVGELDYESERSSAVFARPGAMASPRQGSAPAAVGGDESDDEGGEAVELTTEELYKLRNAFTIWRYASPRYGAQRVPLLCSSLKRFPSSLQFHQNFAALCISLLRFSLKRFHEDELRWQRTTRSDCRAAG